MLNFEARYKTAIKINDATKVLKKLIVTINSENRFEHLIENSQSLELSFISKIDVFIHSMTKFIFETENEDQLI